MNDRFKFRAWDKINDEWVKIPHLSLDVETGMLNGFFDYTEAAKRRYILEQCTGLRDKNGKLIYEGDIVIKSDVSGIGYSRTRVCKVHWHNDWLSWAITTQYGDTYELSEFEPQQYEIIGNIHENADLLEVEND